MRPVRASKAVALTGLAASLALFGCGGDDGSQPPAEPDAGKWRTWVLSSSSAVRVPPPPRSGSEQARADDEGLSAAVEQRTTADEAMVKRWDRSPPAAPWLERAMNYVSQRPKDPPAASRAYALVAVAMEDAAVASAQWKQAYKRKAPSREPLAGAADEPSYPSEHAAMAGAASRVLGYAFPRQPVQRLERDAEEAARSRVVAGVSYPSDARAGLRLGRQVAARVIAQAKRDGSSRRWNGKRPPHSPRYWDPPPGSVGRPVQPLAGSWRTWVMSSGRQFRPPPPPPFGSAGFRAQAREVVQAKKRLTPPQRRAARFWAGGEGTSLPPGIWNQVLIRYLRGRPMSAARSARVLAMLNVAMADAGVAAWDAKYAYWYPRPENGVRDSRVDPDFKPLLQTPLFPAYVSGHATYSAAAGEVLAHLFPGDARVWRARGREAANSRVWGGIHWPVDGEHGALMGRKIGGLVISRAKSDGAER